MTQQIPHKKMKLHMQCISTQPQRFRLWECMFTISQNELLKRSESLWLNYSFRKTFRIKRNWIKNKLIGYTSDCASVIEATKTVLKTNCWNWLSVVSFYLEYPSPPGIDYFWYFKWYILFWWNDAAVLLVTSNSA